jgi:hypothetical protein
MMIQNTISILSPGGQTWTITTASVGYQLQIDNPTGPGWTLGGPTDSITLPMLPLGEEYLIYVQNFGTPPVISIVYDPAAKKYTCNATTGNVMTITIS